MDLFKIWKLVKPLIVPGLLVIAYFQELLFKNDVSKFFIIIIFVLYLFLHGKQIVNGLKELT